jgi:2-keto-4-pentenoate hydratase/2-oxohepta-3-ene-1,7-dioic acid hydratase in catechol pathway
LSVIGTESAVVIGMTGRRIRLEEAMGHVFGYTVNGSLSDLIFDIPTLIATLSSVMTSETGWRSPSTPLARAPTR